MCLKSSKLLVRMCLGAHAMNQCSMPRLITGETAICSHMTCKCAMANARMKICRMKKGFLRNRRCVNEESSFTRKIKNASPDKLADKAKVRNVDEEGKEHVVAYFRCACNFLAKVCT